MKLTIYMKKFRNSDWLRAMRLIPNIAILCYHSANFCYHSAILCYHSANFCFSAYFCYHSAILCYHSAYFCYHSANFCYHILVGKRPSREKQIWRPRLGKLREHFVKIRSELFLRTRAILRSLKNLLVRVFLNCSRSHAISYPKKPHYILFLINKECKQHLAYAQNTLIEVNEYGNSYKFGFSSLREITNYWHPRCSYLRLNFS